MIELSGTLFILTVLLGLYAVVYRQIKKRQTAEIDQQRLAQEKEMSELKFQFFSMISHEFRTPLSIILGSTQALSESSHRWSREKQQKILDRIQSSARSMNQLLTDILTLSRAQVGKLEFHPKLVDVESFCLNLIEDIKYITQPYQKIEFISKGSYESVFLDEKLLNSILSNLLSNAIKYSPIDSTIYFSLINDPDAVTFQIRDQGHGIPISDHVILFEPFSRGQNIVKTTGAGLGLAVVKACVDIHNGEISVISNVGVGSTFTVRIPRNES